jgi:hypothetical protein
MAYRACDNYEGIIKYPSTINPDVLDSYLSLHTSNQGILYIHWLNFIDGLQFASQAVSENKFLE